MAGKRRETQVYEEQEGGSGKIACILMAVALFGVALLLGYIVLAVPESGTAMGAIRNVMYGLGGSMAIVIPMVLVWVGVLMVFAARGKRLAAWRILMNALLFLCLFTGWHLFSAEKIIRETMLIPGFFNFIDKSFRYGGGGGAIGALLCWPLYRYLGTWGGLLATILIALLSLTATGKAGRFLKWSRQRADAARHNSQQRRTVREIEQMFDTEEEPAPRKRARASDPVSDELYIDNPAAMGHVRASGRRTGSNEDVRDETNVRTGRMSDTRARAASRTDRAAREEMRIPDPVKEESPAAKGRKKSGRKLYQENLDAEETLIETEKFDENTLMAEAEEKEPAPRKRERAFKPDTSAAVEEMRSRKAKDSQISIDDDLTIEPDPCDVIETNEEPPFEVPKRGKQPMPKLRRTQPSEEEEEMYNYPPIDLLEVGEAENVNAHRQSDMEKAKLLEETLQSFGISTKLTGIAHGPAVTRFELQPAPGVKVSRITSLADDIAMNLAAMSVRIEAPIPGKAAVGVEIPNEKVEMVRLRDVLDSPDARKSVSKIAVGLGKDNSGRYIVADIAKMPHVLIAGQTGSGKSVCINALIVSILFRATPDEVKLILIDPKMVELSIYNDIPHLVCPVVTDPKKAASALDWAVAEMTTRYKKFAERGVRDIKGYNKALLEGEKQMPQMVIVIDELADLMMVSPGEVEDSICRLAQLARAAGMHLVIATQRPSVNVITGVIKANIPTRIAFSVASQVDSRTMIDHGGAEKLLGNGDMLFVPSGINKPMRVQGAWVSDEEVHAVVSYIKERSETSYDQDMIEQMENSTRTDAEKEEFVSEYDPRLPEAVELVVEAGQASVSMLQRRMRVGYARAGRLIDEMEQRGIVSEADGAKPRTVLITREEMNELFEDE